MKEETTLWRIQEEDFFAAAENELPEASNEEPADPEAAKRILERFSIPYWTDVVGDFIGSLSDEEQQILSAYRNRFRKQKETDDMTHIWARIGVSIQVKPDSQADWVERPEEALLDALRKGRVTLDGNTYLPENADENERFFGEGIEVELDYLKKQNETGIVRF